jgi:uncharacterized protein YceH (UPF0502 family)
MTDESNKPILEAIAALRHELNAHASAIGNDASWKADRDRGPRLEDMPLHAGSVEMAMRNSSGENPILAGIYNLDERVGDIETRINRINERLDRIEGHHVIDKT